MSSILGFPRLEVGFLPTLSCWTKWSPPSHPDYTSCLHFFQFPFSKKLLRPTDRALSAYYYFRHQSRQSYPNPANCTECGSG
jgi:hypothetical protein